MRADAAINSPPADRVAHLSPRLHLLNTDLSVNPALITDGLDVPFGVAIAHVPRAVAIRRPARLVHGLRVRHLVGSRPCVFCGYSSKAARKSSWIDERDARG